MVIPYWSFGTTYRSRLQDRADSPALGSAVLSWKEMARGKNKGGRIVEHIQRQTAKTAKEWTEILERVTGTLKTLA